MAKREKKPKIYRIKLYDTLEEELKSIREEAKIKEEMHRNWDNPEYWKKIYERRIGEPFGSGRIWVICYKIIKP
jgi:signal recognition particle subunit SEC65